jgi:hypothetical protein
LAESDLGFAAGFAQPKDIPMSDALGEVANSEASNGADVLAVGDR